MDSVNRQILLRTFQTRLGHIVWVLITVVGISVISKNSVFASERDPRIIEEVYQFHKMTVTIHPVNPPPAVPKFLIPEGAVLFCSTDLRSNFYTTLESFLVMNLPQSKEKLDRFYNEVLQTREWKLLQSDYRENVSVYLAEGFSRKILTITIQKIDDSSSRVRISFKKNSSF